MPNERFLHDVKSAVDHLRSQLTPTVLSVEVKQDAADPRWVKRVETWTDGRRFVSHIRSSEPMFRGTHQRGARYTKGDLVVFGGSTWACLETTTDAPGTQTKAWMIAARKGKDGKP